MIQTSIQDKLTPNIQALARVLPEEARKVAGVAGLAIIQDAIDKAPTPPIKTGNLRGSWFVYAGNKLLQAGGDANAPQSIDAPPISASVGFNAKYAMRMHEKLDPAGPLQPGPVSRQAGNVGGKFLESKLLAYGSRYAQIVADGLKKAIADKVRGLVKLP